MSDARLSSGKDRRQGIMRILAAAGLAPFVGGCLFVPFDLQVRRLQEHVDVLERRVDQVEQAHLVSGALPPAPTIGAAGLDGPVGAGAAEVESAPAPPKAGLPSVPVDWGKAFGKLVRGLTNIVTGWVEVPKRVHETTERSGPGAGFTFGLVRGLGYGFIRTIGGAYETITFPFPAPPDYRPVMRPPYVFQGDEAFVSP